MIFQYYLPSPPENLGDIITQEGIVTSEEAVEEFLGRTVKTADLNIVNASKEDSSTQGMGVAEALERAIPSLPRKEIARASIDRNGKIIIQSYRAGRGRFPL